MGCCVLPVNSVPLSCAWLQTTVFYAAEHLASLHRTVRIRISGNSPAGGKFVTWGPQCMGCGLVHLPRAESGPWNLLGQASSPEQAGPHSGWSLLLGDLNILERRAVWSSPCPASSLDSMGARSPLVPSGRDSTWTLQYAQPGYLALAGRAGHWRPRRTSSGVQRRQRRKGRGRKCPMD